jgi:site-specific recombinase XerD
MKKIMTLDTVKEETLVNAFEEFIRVGKIKNISVRTIKSYKDCYRYFTEFVDENTPCKFIQHSTVLDYIENLRNTREDIAR